MAVLIKGMEMPKNCYECPFGLLEYTSQYYSKTIRNKFACCITHKAKTSTRRNRFCPLVEVPTPHGRLIDADVLTGEQYMQGNIMVVEMDAIENAPTIIEAEE